MDRGLRRRRWPRPPLLLAAAALSLLDLLSGQPRYAVPEETAPGALVGDLARDLGTGAQSLSARRLRLVGDGGRRQPFRVNLADGALLVQERIDREEMCGASTTCLLPLQLVLESPLILHRIEVEILDVNDNSPFFPREEVSLEIIEVASPGTRLALELAEDPDVGSNSIATYELTSSDYFSLSIRTRDDGVKLPEIVLDRALDREQIATYHLKLTAIDGGNPARSGTARITVNVLDVNDNSPRCDPSFLKIHLQENVPLGTLVVKLNATDLDEGPNGEIEYYFKPSNNAPEKIPRLFNLDLKTGEIRTKGIMDFEESSAYEIVVRARDKGSPATEGLCNVKVEITDLNDNSPEIVLTSLSSPIQENVSLGTVIALISVKDNDSGENGQVHLHIPTGIPFKLISSFKDHYSLVTNGLLDREKSSQYNITIIGNDSGFPSRSTQETIFLQISDVNDNVPKFPNPTYTIHVQENNLPGSSICSVSASDPDGGDNSKISYSLLSYSVQDLPLSSFFYINSENGTIYTFQSLDYEQNKVFQIIVQARDAGSPSLSSTVTVHLFVFDQNDNTPRIVYPPVEKGSVVQQAIPLSAEPGYFVTKLVAVDADSGHNAWLSYHLQQSKEPCPFRVEPHSGEIRITQALKELEVLTYRLIVLVKDHGTPPLSTSVTLEVSLEDNVLQDFSKARDLPKSSYKTSDVTLYLIISLAAISFVSFAMFAALAVKCLRSSHSNAKCISCCRRSHKGSRDMFKYPVTSMDGQLSPEDLIKYIEVGRSGLASQPRCYRSCFSPVSDQSDFMFVKPFSRSTTGESVNTSEPFVSTLFSPCDVQAQPNTDWRFSQAQRPGTSGSQNPEEGGAWPNNQLETERLQAMILASANAGPIEAADGSSTLGGAAGTMGLSTRYGPQFTLQHVPDYRQNVYIPGNTATLTNSAGKRDGKGATSSGGNKKKSGKKEKK
ncbi:protocadherin gamma-C5-like isoform X1 [Rhinatrema bivittatum]|uniref:protocadherin gamma-C5-like isoform X1 n=1 Tax=Rhinatrema bivittatum TaxID=194408 RepID=UPI0011286ED9|nr:protocadherin gamma-C5-like isoform X1 [Rhinatrema bivittatum]